MLNGLMLNLESVPCGISEIASLLCVLTLSLLLRQGLVGMNWCDIGMSAKDNPVI
jgi:hypothetical protein